VSEAFPLGLTEQEYRLVEKLAKKRGVSVDEMSSALVSAAIGRRVRKRTGKGPARVYAIKRRPAG
jgi:hypothetical protein